MTKTKSQQAQEYAEKFPPIPDDDIAYAIGCAWLDGRALDTAFYEDGEWLVYGYTVAYWMNIPSLPDTNTEKK